MKTSLALAVAAALLTTAVQAQPWPPIEKCVPGQQRAADEYCLVDGDTIWIDGLKLRMEGWDTPEPMGRPCGVNERDVAERATNRVLELLNGNDWTVEYGGIDNTGQRTLVNIRIDGVDIGETLVDEGLARWWPHGDRFWCDQ